VAGWRTAVVAWVGLASCGPEVREAGDPDAIELAFVRRSGSQPQHGSRVVGAVPGDFTVDLISLGEDVWVESLGWSFDGKHVALSTSDPPQAEVVVFSIASRETIVFPGMWEAYWSPVAPEFLAWRGSPPESEQVLVDFDIGSTRVVGPRCSSVSWAPDGQRWACLDFENALHIVDRATATATVVPVELPVNAVAWSPTGDVIACVALDPTSWEYANIISVTPDGQDARRWDHGEVVFVFSTPVWSPDGRQLAVPGMRFDANDPSDYFVSIFDAGTATSVARVDGSTSVSWADDGRRATTNRVGTGSRIVVTDGGSDWFSARLDTTVSDGNPTWRPR
jgi:hypothetical protein